MSDWAAVVLVLGLSALVVAFYAVRALVGVRAAVLDVKALQSACDARRDDCAVLEKRLSVLEKAMRIEGQALMAEANRRALPAMMRIAVMFVSAALVFS